MPLTKLQFRPGIVRDQTSYTNEGGWRDGDLVRFRLGFPESIGGWQKYSDQTYIGTCRSLHNWTSLSGDNLMAVGTHRKFYIEEGSNYFDITPVRATATLSNPFSATNGSTVLTVTDVDHGCVEGDFVTFSGAVSLGGLVTAPVLNQEYEIVRVVSPDVYEVALDVAANASDTGGGGTSVTAAYQINVGVNTQVGGTGWGAGPWPLPNSKLLTNPFTTTNGSTTVTVTHAAHGLVTGNTVYFSGATNVGGILAVYFTFTTSITYVGVNSYTITVPFPATSSTTGGGVVTAYTQTGTRGWGTGTDVTTTTALRIWSQDNYGEDCIFAVRNGGIYYWDWNTGLGTRGVALNTLSTDPTCPTIATQVLVSDRDRHVVAFGADFGDGVQDPMLVRWSSQEDPFDWSAAPDNTAGDLRLGNGSFIVRAVETKRAILVFTDNSIYSMQYIGPPYTFGLDQIASNAPIAGYNAAVAMDDTVFWMGKDSFNMFTGQVITLPCPIEEYIFENINRGQFDKIYAGINTAFNEVTWFYPSLDSDECDRYVTYNYLEQAWTYGNLARTAWVDRGLRPYPMAANNSDHRLYNHELGYNDGSVSPAVALPSYIESSPVDIGDGDRYMLVRRILPDLNIRTQGSPGTGKTVDMTIKAQNFPGANYRDETVSPIVKITNTPIGQYTNEAFVRVRGRSIVLRVGSNQTDMGWRLGSPRLDIRPDGGR
jgi:hypothetical protein